MDTRWLMFAAPLAICSFVSADEPLHRRIDAQIQSTADAQGIKLQPPAGDAEFVRRVYLDLAGRIPTADEVRLFLADESPGKRTTLVDQLLAKPGFARRMADQFHVMLMERRGEHEEWTRFLRSAFGRNAPWDEIATAIIQPDAEDEHLRGAAYFMTARLVSEGAMADVDVPGLTRDVGRLLAGVDLQCAQCHDHLDIEDYTQQDFQGLHMVFENVQVRRDTKFPAVSEKLMTEKKQYMSVFIQKPEETGPVVPGGREVEIVTFEKDREYATPPDKKKRIAGVPKFSPQRELAAGLTAKDNRLFAKNIANRMWFAMLGRGLVEPLDLQHAENPASHPELLSMLASELAARDYDLRWLVRQLALSETYQRTSLLADSEAAPPSDSFAVAAQRRLSAEQLFRSVLSATGELSRHGVALDAPPDSVDAAISKSDELKKLQASFKKAYANPPKEPELEFAPTVEAALFVMHDEALLKLLTPREGNLIDRLGKMEDQDAMIDELFLSVLSRPPTAEDRQDAAAFLANHAGERDAAIAQLAWALLASTEFCVNH